LPSPAEDELPYRQYLLSWKPMLILDAEDEQRKARFFNGLHSRVQGVPSRLSSEDKNYRVKDWVEASRDLGFLIVADDDEVLKAMGKGK